MYQRIPWTTARQTSCMVGRVDRIVMMTDKVWKIWLQNRQHSISLGKKAFCTWRRRKIVFYGLFWYGQYDFKNYRILAKYQQMVVKAINVKNLCQGRFLPKVKWRKKDRNEKQRIGSITMWWEGCITASEWLSMLHSPSICILVNTYYIRKQLCSSSSITYSVSLISCFVVHFFFFSLICNTNT